MARPKVKIDVGELEKLATLQCTEDEMALYLGISVRTLQRRLQIAKFHDVVASARAKGSISVRRHLFRLAAAGNIAAVIFLAKNVLGYRDVVNTEHTGLAGGPIQIATKPDLSDLTDEELKLLRTVFNKIKSRGRD